MIQSVKVKNLSLSKDNVRKSNRDADLDSLADNIAAHGLLQNLVVTPLKKAGHFTVKAGGRRLRALQRLIDSGRLAGDHEVQVLVLEDDAGSAEASLAENFHRVAMNPADECSEEHTSELQSLMRISYAVFCLKKKNIKQYI